MSVAVIGAGVSGIGAAKVLKQCGYHVSIYEKSTSLGGVWAIGYQDISIQSFDFQYHYTDFPWPIECDKHPTAGQVLEYLYQAVKHYDLDVYLSHEVVTMEERSDGWLVHISSPTGETVRYFQYVLVCSGIFADGKFRPDYPQESDFRGEVLTEREIVDPSYFDGRRVVVVGYGKSALDMTVLSAPRSLSTVHLFRDPHWTLPEKLFGVSFSSFIFSRIGSSMITCWSQPSVWSRFVHSLQAVIYFYWQLISWFIKMQTLQHACGKSQAAKASLLSTHPIVPLMQDRRFVVATMPDGYYHAVVSGHITPMHSYMKSFYDHGIVLANGENVPCDLVVLSLGNQTPAFPFLPEKHRWLMEREGGAQLYRHLVHPWIPRMGFVGLNHCFLHIPAVEIGTLWIIATWRGELELPSVEDMEESVKRVRDWKNDNVAFEPTRSYLILTRFQQYLDTLLLDLGLNPYRKMPNIFAEIFSRYGAADYKGVFAEFRRVLRYREAPLHPSEWDA